MRVQISIVGTLLAVFATACAGKPISGAELTATQELIKNEIIRLGGDWEPRLIGFIGPKFTERHFEMLEHMTGVENVALFNVNVPPGAYSSIAKMSTVRWLEIQDGPCSAEGIEALRTLPQLSKVIIERATFTKKGIESLSQLDKLAELDLGDVDLPPRSVNMLAKMRGLKTLSIITGSQIDRQEIDQLKASLPNAEIDITSKSSP